MSYASLDAASKDQALVNRVIAGVQQEARTNPELMSTPFAAEVRDNPAEGVQLIWPVALNTEAEYASALAAGNPNPGGDPAVITDGMISERSPSLLADHLKGTTMSDTPTEPEQPEQPDVPDDEPGQDFDASDDEPKR